MSDIQELAYFILRYAPDVTSETAVDIGFVLFDPVAPKRFCRLGFVTEWSSKVLQFDANADIALLEDIVSDLAQCLTDTDTVGSTLNQMEHSFSNVIRVSERQVCYTCNPAAQMEKIVSLLRRGPNPGE